MTALRQRLAPVGARVAEARAGEKARTIAAQTDVLISRVLQSHSLSPGHRYLPRSQIDFIGPSRVVIRISLHADFTTRQRARSLSLPPLWLRQRRP